MISNIQYLFFDLGSTLLDETECDKAVILYSVTGSFVSFGEFDAAMKYYSSHNRPAYKSALKDFGLPKASWDSSLERLYPDTVRVLTKLSEKYRLAVVANQLPGVSERLEKFGILHFFDFVLSSAEFGCAKPDKRIFLEALRLASCKPEQAVMIGDRLDNDIQPAQQLGLKTVWVKQGYGGYGDPRLLPQMPDFTVDILIELLGIL